MNEINQTFLRKPGVLERKMGVETILYTGQMDAVHVLNRSARLIWDLCDGSHTLADMEQALREQFAVGANVDLYPDIRLAIEGLLEKGLVSVVSNEI
jgi:hypothetical protein